MRPFCFAKASASRCPKPSRRSPRARRTLLGLTDRGRLAPGLRADLVRVREVGTDTHGGRGLARGPADRVRGGMLALGSLVPGPWYSRFCRCRPPSPLRWCRLPWSAPHETDTVSDYGLLDTRYAIYFAPPPGSALKQFADAWLGRDPDSDERVPQPVVEGITPSGCTRSPPLPRHYGFHATLKAPFTPCARARVRRPARRCRGVRRRAPAVRCRA